MDSVNSGSLQSSSAGDDEYDSRAAEVSPFQISIPPPQQQPFFDPGNYLRPRKLNQNWPSIRSDANPIPHQIINSSAFPPAFHPPPSVAAAELQNHPNHPNPPGRNPKKRSRASRRAPTTVLTTDTTNFRAMVQEFTGIPSPPFDSSPFPRPRLDLFGASRSAAPTHLLRPFAHKPQPAIPFSAASSSSAAANNNYQNNLFQNPFIANFLSPKFPFPDPFQIPPSADHSHFGNHFSPQPNDGNFENLSGGGKQPENNVGGGEGMVESWICSSE